MRGKNLYFSILRSNFVHVGYSTQATLKCFYNYNMIWLAMLCYIVRQQQLYQKTSESVVRSTRDAEYVLNLYFLNSAFFGDETKTTIYVRVYIIIIQVLLSSRKYWFRSRGMSWPIDDGTDDSTTRTMYV